MRLVKKRPTEPGIARWAATLARCHLELSFCWFIVSLVQGRRQVSDDNAGKVEDIKKLGGNRHPAHGLALT
ncbi:hypothetical protein GCM10008942_23980 [Rhizomicrobium electricum]|uniref:Uncharacterized protein n=1 Tax=Rhizomicrobium electricum TaxID=480070 RepID=A0ABN1EU43_9PROT